MLGKLVSFNAVFGITVVLGMCIGCGSSPVKPAGEQAKVIGAVTINGKPIPIDSEVVFYNADKGITLGAKVDANGKFSLAAADPKIGIPTGRYQVAIRPAAVPAPKVGGDDYAKAMMGGGASATTPASPIPTKFKDYSTSKVEQDLKAGPNEVNLDLSKL